MNLGKGRSLKDAFNYALITYPDLVGVVTADSDGQHTAECIKNVRDTLLDNPQKLVFGVRNFDGNDIPWKSVFGNKLTRNICKFLCGINFTGVKIFFSVS